MELAILTVAYHSQAPLEQLAADLARQGRGPDRWLVVDNAPISAPLRISGALAALPLERIEGREGAGFGEGCNRGLAALASQGWQGWVWLLNPDTSLQEPGLIESLTTLLPTLPPRALLGTAVWEANGSLETSGGWIDPGLAFRSRRIGAGHLAAASTNPLRLDWLSGCSLMLRPAAHSPPPRFDPQLPLYYEDVDLCLRLGADGAPCLWSAAVAVHHQRGSGSGGDPQRRARLTTISYWRFLQRHRHAWVRALRGLRLLATATAKLPIRPQRSMAVLRGLATAIREPIGPVPSDPSAAQR
ncbi:MAG: glycosyltransferase family 2 protein [Synechococcus sp.]